MLALTAALVLAATPTPSDDAVAKAVFPAFDADSKAVSDTEVLGETDITATPAGWLVLLAVRSKEPNPSAGTTIALLETKTLKVLSQIGVYASSNYANEASFDAALGKGAKLLIPVHAGSRSDGEGTELRTVYVAVVDGKVTPALTITEQPSSGSGYPHLNETVTQRVLGTTTNGFPDIAETRAREKCETPDECVSDDLTRVWRFNGKAYASSVSGDPLIKSASSSSFLKEKKMPPRYYAAEQAIDGVAETAWVEGVKGPGLGESLTLELKAPTVLTAITLLAGCGVTDALWGKNHRLKSVTVSLDDGPGSELVLEDAHREQTFPLTAKAPVKRVKLTLSAVFKGKSYDDACISEIRLKGP